MFPLESHKDKTLLMKCSTVVWLQIRQPQTTFVHRQRQLQTAVASGRMAEPEPPNPEKAKVHELLEASFAGAAPAYVTAPAVLL